MKKLTGWYMHKIGFRRCPYRYEMFILYILGWLSGDLPFSQIKTAWDFGKYYKHPKFDYDRDKGKKIGRLPR